MPYKKLAADLTANREPLRRDVLKTLNDAINLAGNHDAAILVKRLFIMTCLQKINYYSIPILYNEGPKSVLNVQEVKPVIPADAPAD